MKTEWNWADGQPIPAEAPVECRRLYNQIDTDRTHGAWAWALLGEITGAAHSPHLLSLVLDDISTLFGHNPPDDIGAPFGHNAPDAAPEPADVPFWVNLAGREDPRTVDRQMQKFIDAIESMAEAGGRLPASADRTTSARFQIECELTSAHATLGVSPAPGWNHTLLREIAGAGDSQYRLSQIARTARRTATEIKKPGNAAARDIATDPGAPEFLRAAAVSSLYGGPSNTETVAHLLVTAADALTDHVLRQRQRA